MVANGNQTPPFSPIILDLQEFELQILLRTIPAVFLDSV